MAISKQTFLLITLFGANLAIADNFAMMPNTNLIDGKVSPGESNWLVDYYGTTQTPEACQQMCNQHHRCAGFTWHAPETGDYAYQCYGIKTNPGWRQNIHESAQEYHFSGMRGGSHFVNGFDQEPNVNLINGEVRPFESNHNVTYLGNTNSPGECQALCASHNNCAGYTWHSPYAMNYENQCYGVNLHANGMSYFVRTPGVNHFSGVRMDGA
jgi:hypothetical protein